MFFFDSCENVRTLFAMFGMYCGSKFIDAEKFCRINVLENHCDVTPLNLQCAHIVLNFIYLSYSSESVKWETIFTGWSDKQGITGRVIDPPPPQKKTGKIYTIKI